MTLDLCDNSCRSYQKLLCVPVKPSFILLKLKHIYRNKTNCSALFLSPLSSSALSGLQMGSILWSPCTATKGNATRKNTQNLILCTGNVHPRTRRLKTLQLVTLQVWHCSKMSVHAYSFFFHFFTRRHTNPRSNTHVLLCDYSWFHCSPADLNICSSHPSPC